MLYYGNVREDGRVIQPHELVYKDAILNGLTGLLTLTNHEITIPIDESPIEFVLLDYYGNGINSISVYIMYNGYTRMYNRGKMIEVTDLGTYRYYYGGVINDDLHVQTMSNTFIWRDYKKECKQLLSIENYDRGIHFVYIDHNNEIQNDSNTTQSFIILNRFIVISYNKIQRIFVYDINEHILHYNGYRLFNVLYSIREIITDMKVYKDNVEIYTTSNNYYFKNEDNKDMLKELPDGWSVKPRFNMRSKSARKID